MPTAYPTDTSPSSLPLSPQHALPFLTPPLSVPSL